MDKLQYESQIVELKAENNYMAKIPCFLTYFRILEASGKFEISVNGGAWSYFDVAMDLPLDAGEITTLRFRAVEEKEMYLIYATCNNSRIGDDRTTYKDGVMPVQIVSSNNTQKAVNCAWNKSINVSYGKMFESRNDDYSIYKSVNGSTFKGRKLTLSVEIFGDGVPDFYDNAKFYIILSGEEPEAGDVNKPITNRVYLFNFDVKTYVEKQQFEIDIDDIVITDLKINVSQNSAGRPEDFSSFLLIDYNIIGQEIYNV